LRASLLYHHALLHLAKLLYLRQKGCVKHEGNVGRGRQRAQAWGPRVPVLLVLALAWATTAAGENFSPTVAHREADARLMQAAQQGDLSLAEAAIAEGANVNCRGTNGVSPLLEALSGATAPINAGRRQCLAFLLKNGAEVDGKDSDGRTALIYAARAGDLETVQLLVEGGAIIKRRDRFHKTAVLYAAEGGRREILIYLGQTLKVQTGQAGW